MASDLTEWPPMPIEAPETTSTLSFDKFWSWIHAHRNCIVRVGTPYSILIDHDDFHWDIVDEGEAQILQLVRGKDLVGEIVVLHEEIDYVHCPPGSSDQQLFECVIESPHGREVVYHFVMNHGFEHEPEKIRHWTH